MSDSDLSKETSAHGSDSDETATVDMKSMFAMFVQMQQGERGCLEQIREAEMQLEEWQRQEEERRRYDEERRQQDEIRRKEEADRWVQLFQMTQEATDKRRAEDEESRI